MRGSLLAEILLDFEDVGFGGGVAIEGDAGGGIHIAGFSVFDEKLGAFAFPDAGAVDPAGFGEVAAFDVVVEPMVGLGGFAKLEAIFGCPVKSATLFDDAVVVGGDEVDQFISTVVGIAILDALFVGCDGGGLNHVGAFKVLGDGEPHLGAF